MRENIKVRVTRAGRDGRLEWWVCTQQPLPRPLPTRHSSFWRLFLMSFHVDTLPVHKIAGVGSSATLHLFLSSFPYSGVFCHSRKSNMGNIRKRIEIK